MRGGEAGQRGGVGELDEVGRLGGSGVGDRVGHLCAHAVAVAVVLVVGTAGDEQHAGSGERSEYREGGLTHTSCHGGVYPSIVVV